VRWAGAGAAKPTATGHVSHRVRFEVSDHVVAVVFLLQAGERHLVARDKAFGVFQVLGQRFFIPGNAGFGHRGRILEAFDRSRRTAHDAVQRWADPILTCIQGVAGLAFVVDLLALVGVTVGECRGAHEGCDRGQSVGQGYDSDFHELFLSRFEQFGLGCGRLTQFLQSAPVA